MCRTADRHRALSSLPAVPLPLPAILSLPSLLQALQIPANVSDPNPAATGRRPPARKLRDRPDTSKGWPLLFFSLSYIPYLSFFESPNSGSDCSLAISASLTNAAFGN